LSRALTLSPVNLPNQCPALCLSNGGRVVQVFGEKLFQLELGYSAQAFVMDEVGVHSNEALPQTDEM
jgi:hypothetical protein